MRTSALLALALGLLGDAAAQPVATGARRPAPHPPAGLGGTLTVGRAGMAGVPTGWVADDTGVGLYAPLACARVGGDVLGVQLGGDARIVRRWQIGAPDHTQWQLGVFAGGTWESKDRRPRY